MDLRFDSGGRLSLGNLDLISSGNRWLIEESQARVWQVGSMNTVTDREAEDLVREDGLQ